MKRSSNRLLEVVEALSQWREELEEEVKNERANRAGRSHTVAACVTKEEKKELDELCDELAESYGRKLTRGALLRLVFLHFKDNHEDIDLSPYQE